MYILWGGNMKRITIAIFIVLLCISLFVLSSCKSDNEDKLVCVDYKLTNEGYAFGVSKENAELLGQANSLLNEIKENGKLNEIINKYFSNDTSKIKTFEAGIKDETKNQLVVATHIPFEPFEYKIGNRYCGIDIEIASLLAQGLNCELVIEEYHFSEILEAIENGSADIVMAGLSVTEKRQKQISFTDTYFEASQVIIVREGNNAFKDCKSPEDVSLVLSKMNKCTKIGYQENTVTELYLKGDMESGFNGFSVETVAYESAYEAAKALKNGEIDYLVVDEGPAKIIVEHLNSK